MNAERKIQNSEKKYSECRYFDISKRNKIENNMENFIIPKSYSPRTSEEVKDFKEIQENTVTKMGMNSLPEQVFNNMID